MVQAATFLAPEGAGDDQVGRHHQVAQFDQVVADAEIRVELVDLAGEQPDPRAKKIAASRGYDLSGMRSRRVAEDDFSHFDLVLAMDKQNLAALERVCPDEHLHKLGLFMEYAENPECDEIPDPYYGGPDGFERVLDMCEAAACGLIASIAGPGRRR